MVGGGIAGLAAAHAIHRRGGEVLVLESAERAGGYVHSEEMRGALIELGPQGFLSERPGVLDVVEDLGLSGRVVAASGAAKRRYVLHGGRLVPLPSSPPALLASPLLSTLGKFRLLLEPFARKAPSSPESVHDFATRRIGSEAARVFVDAAVTGIYGGDPERLSLEACFPKMRAMERESGSLLKALVKKSRQGSSAFGKRLMSFHGGMEELARAYTSSLASRVRLGTEVIALEKVRRGFRAKARAGEVFEAERAIVALPANVAAKLLAPSIPALAHMARELEAASVAVLGFVFRRDRVGHALDGYGFLAPGGRSPLLGCLFESSVFPSRAPQGCVLLRALVGGSRQPGALRGSSEAILDAALGALRPLLCLEGDPELTRCAIHPRAIPQYGLAHPARIREVEEDLSGFPGLFLAGASYRGVSVNHLVAEGETLARRVMA